VSTPSRRKNRFREKDVYHREKNTVTKARLVLSFGRYKTKRIMPCGLLKNRGEKKGTGDTWQLILSDRKSRDTNGGRSLEKSMYRWELLRTMQKEEEELGHISQKTRKSPGTLSDMALQTGRKSYTWSWEGGNEGSVGREKIWVKRGKSVQQASVEGQLVSLIGPAKDGEWGYARGNRRRGERGVMGGGTLPCDSPIL